MPEGLWPRRRLGFWSLRRLLRLGGPASGWFCSCRRLLRLGGAPRDRMVIIAARPDIVTVRS